MNRLIQLDHDIEVAVTTALGVAAVIGLLLIALAAAMAADFIESRGGAR